VARVIPDRESREYVARVVADVAPDQADQIVALLQPSIRFSGLLTPGYGPALQLGGGAALPPDIAWPEHDGRMMHLVAVIDLAQVAEVDPTGLVPKTGMLHFFYDAVACKWGYDPQDRDSWSVVLVPEPRPGGEHERQYRAVYPGDEQSPHPTAVLFEERHGAPYVQWTIPDGEEPDLSDIEWPVGKIGARFIVDLANRDWDLMLREHQMLGWPNVIQNPMRLDCQLAANGVNTGSAGYESVRAAELHDGLYDWVLLLQLDSWGEYEGGGRWGPDGMLYFWIRRNDLLTARFDQVWVILRTWS